MVGERVPTWVAGVWVALTAPGCRAPAAPPAAGVAVAVDRTSSTSDERAYVEGIETEADAWPDDFAVQKRSGMALMWLVLGGRLDLLERAEARLERAFALDPSNEELDRSLGRFYNLRSVGGDWHKAELQARVYRAYLGDRDPAAMDTEHFVAYTFMRMGEALAHANQGHQLAALRTVRDLESDLEAKLRAEPDDMEIWATAGNFAFFFAGNIPIGQQRRVEQAVERFEVLRAHWDELRPGARDARRCPNTRDNFMFELAEGYLVLKQPQRAAEIYRELITVRDPPTPARRQIASASAHRLEYLDLYSGRMELMPPWPSDVGNCIVCHAHRAPVPTATFFHLRPVRWDDGG